MHAKTVIVFWASVVASVFLLGGTIGAADSAFRDPSLVTATVLALSIIGLVVAWAIAARIMIVVGRGQRRQRPTDA